MPDVEPSAAEMTELVGDSLYALWQTLCAAIDARYDMERLWNSGGRKWVYEYKYRRGGKTLCALYAKPGVIGLMLIFGRDERAAVEALRGELSEGVIRAYDEATTYRDGKWVMFTPTDASMLADYLRLLAIKRRPNGKVVGR